jgi:hypothetical protein
MVCPVGILYHIIEKMKTENLLAVGKPEGMWEVWIMWTRKWTEKLWETKIKVKKRGNSYLKLKFYQNYVNICNHKKIHMLFPQKRRVSMWIMWITLLP